MQDVGRDLRHAGAARGAQQIARVSRSSLEKELAKYAQKSVSLIGTGEHERPNHFEVFRHMVRDPLFRPAVSQVVHALSPAAVRRILCSDFLASWGGDELVQPSERPQPGREIRVYLTSDGERIHVGSLFKDQGEYVFEYSPQFKEHKELAPISAFREVSQPHRTKDLPAFFRVRVPPLEREDVKRTVAELGIPPDDEFALLAAVGRKTIASPYELELRESEHHSARPSRRALAHG